MLRMIFVAALVTATPAIGAQEMKKAPAMSPSDVSCADFAHNPDGSWTPTKTVTMGSIKLKAKKPLKPGTMIGGMDIAAHLSDACSDTKSST